MVIFSTLLSNILWYVPNFKDYDGGRMDGMIVLNGKVPLLSGVRRSGDSAPMT